MVGVPYIRGMYSFFLTEFLVFFLFHNHTIACMYGACLGVWTNSLRYISLQQHEIFHRILYKIKYISKIIYNV